MVCQPEAFWLASAAQGSVTGSHRCHLKIVAPLAVSVSPTRGVPAITGVGGSSAASAIPAKARPATTASSRSRPLRTLIEHYPSANPSRSPPANQSEATIAGSAQTSPELSAAAGAQWPVQSSPRRAQPPLDNVVRHLGGTTVASHGPDEVVAIESQQSGPHGSADRRGSRLTAKQSDLTKRLALTLKLPMGAVLEYLDAASVDQVEAIAD